jgi:hypothetical protein
MFHALVARVQLLAHRQVNFFKLWLEQAHIGTRQACQKAVRHVVTSGALLSAKYQSQTTYLMLVEITRAVDQSFLGRSKRDDRLL